MKNKKLALLAMALSFSIHALAVDPPTAAKPATQAATTAPSTPTNSMTADQRNYVEFKRPPAETRVNLNLGPFAYGKNSTYGLIAGFNLEYWNVEKSYIDSFGIDIIKASDQTKNVHGAFYFEAISRVFVGPMVGMEYSEHSGFGALSARVLGPDPAGQRFFSILYTEINMGLRSTGTPYGSLSFGMKLF